MFKRSALPILMLLVMLEEESSSVGSLVEIQPLAQWMAQTECQVVGEWVQESDTKEVFYLQEQWQTEQQDKYTVSFWADDDCTNFVSQALYAGGINQTSQIWNGWWISGWNHGTAWTAVEALDDIILSGPSSGSGGPKGYNAGGAWGVTGGDVIQYEWGNSNGGWDHSVIVVDRRGYYPNALAYVASHTPDHDWYPHYYFSYNGIRFFHITGQW